MKCGIVGLPNVGKSTLFNAITKSGIDAENYPFCTIEPNVGIVEVPDNRLQEISSIVNPEKIQPAIVEFVDIAGLVAGASKGEGLGNKFLANIRETDAIGHVVRCFEDDNIVHVANQVSPASDIETINTELILADMETLEKAIQREEKKAKSGDKEARQSLEIFSKISTALNDGKPASSVHFDEDDFKLVRPLCLITIKPVMFAANVSEQGFDGNPLLEKLQNYASSLGCPVIPVCAKIESEISDLDDEEKLIFLSDFNLTEPGLNRVIRGAYELLGLQTYFTAGVKETRAWTINIGDSAPKAAGKIHGDFEKGFIRAEVIAFDDFIAFSGEKGAKENGKLRSEGKEYIMKDGDVVHFLFNV